MATALLHEALRRFHAWQAEYPAQYCEKIDSEGRWFMLYRRGLPERFAWIESDEDGDAMLLADRRMDYRKASDIIDLDASMAVALEWISTQEDV
jgi:hypothetical protein